MVYLSLLRIKQALLMSHLIKHRIDSHVDVIDSKIDVIQTNAEQLSILRRTIQMVQY